MSKLKQLIALQALSVQQNPDTPVAVARALIDKRCTDSNSEAS